MNPAIALIKKFESCKLAAYKCPAGKDTIGYGHTGPDVHPGLTITQAQADALLAADLKKFSDGVDALVTVPINSNQRGALICFAYNVGLGIGAITPVGLKHSTLLRKVNAGDHAGAAEQFSRWDLAAGKVLPGLVKRRAAEAALYREA